VVTAPHAQAFVDGASVRAVPPATEIWVVLYVQVMQADRGTMRNVQLDLERASLAKVPRGSRQQLAAAHWDDRQVAALLARLGLDERSPLSALAIELLPEPNGTYGDALAGDLGEVRILRTSPLSPIETRCC